MKQIPMTFNTEMVKALLDGRKTVTRRPIQIPDGWELHDRVLSKITSSHPKKGKWGALIRKGVNTDFPQSDLIPAPCFVGDLLYVRETFATLHSGDYQEISPWETSCQEVRYKASEPQALAYESDHEIRGYKWRPSIHMPKHCSRLTLKVIDVRIERVQEITEQQAVAEGMPTDEECQQSAIKAGLGWYQKPAIWFKNTWDRIYSNWSQNPYTWVIEFEVIHSNVSKVASQTDKAA
ncbi:TPA: hypothetical protein NJ623_004487 [Vibrio parahaemolyticus]|nr:hypothetical protein [Vibrio parahaemolyticus]